jgi:hypothetical protein
MQSTDPGAINAELLAKSPDTVPLLLSFLEEEPVGTSDFYVRYHTVQLLTALAAGGPYRLQGVRCFMPSHLPHDNHFGTSFWQIPCPRMMIHTVDAHLLDTGYASREDKPYRAAADFIDQQSMIAAGHSGGTHGGGALDGLVGR